MNKRHSGIELLKIVAIFLIILSHVLSDLYAERNYILYNDYIFDFVCSSTNPTIIFFQILQYSGMTGNAIFFICSTWFLLDKKTSSKKKILYMIADVWVISICIFIPTIIMRGGGIDSKLIIQSIFPTIFENNWYITCYILFMFLYPILNKIIDMLSQKSLLRVSLFLGVIYLGICFIYPVLYATRIISWISVYFILAYIKIYLPNITESKKINIIILILGIVMNTILALLTNFIGFKIPLISDHVIYWTNNYNPFLYMIAFGSLNIVRKLNFHSKFINRVSSLSMLIYIIHENLLLKTYYRPLIWHQIYINFGYQYIICWVFLLTIAIFIVSAIVSFIWSKTGQILVHKTCDKVYPLLSKILQYIETKIFKVITIKNKS